MSANPSPQLPEPDCELGYTAEQLQTMFGNSLPEFYNWMRGQTGAICEGLSFNHDTRTYELSACGEKGENHGPIVYAHDVKRYIEGRPIID